MHAFLQKYIVVGVGRQGHCVGVVMRGEED